MPIFKCEQCGCIENTATSNYWERQLENKSKLCSQCDPEIAQWHGEFERELAAGFKLGADGFLYHPDEIASGYAKTKIIGDA